MGELGRAIAVSGLVSLPLLIPMLIIGVIIGIVQAATSIHEQTLSFVPKLVVLGSVSPSSERSCRRLWPFSPRVSLRKSRLSHADGRRSPEARSGLHRRCVIAGQHQPASPEGSRCSRVTRSRAVPRIRRGFPATTCAQRSRRTKQRVADRKNAF